MSATAKRYAELYSLGKVSLNGLKRAVTLKLITADEYKAITGKKYTA